MAELVEQGRPTPTEGSTWTRRRSLLAVLAVAAVVGAVLGWRWWSHPTLLEPSGAGYRGDHEDTDQGPPPAPRRPLRRGLFLLDELRHPAPPWPVSLVSAGPNAAANGVREGSRASRACGTG